jgi:hypothetical protein
LKKNPHSIFAKYGTKELAIDKLCSVSKTLIIKLLPDNEQNSAALFSITKEIITGKVFLPMFAKVTNPIFLNELLLEILRKKSDDLIVIIS